MQAANRAKRFFRNLFRREQIEQTLEAELRMYLEDSTDRNIRRGMLPEEARRQALLEVGGIDQVKESVREAWLGHGLETMVQDVRYACRSLMRSPGFTAIVVVTLALGICANLTMFSLMRAVLWRPLPYPDPDRIVTIQVDARNISNTGATTGEVRDLREQSRSFEQVSVINPTDVNLEYAGEAEQVSAAQVSNDFLPLLGVSPALGRPLDSQIDQGGQQVLAGLISDELWRRRFSADPGVIRTGVRINNADVQIVGVLPAALRLFLPASVNASEQIDIWLPYAMDTTRPYRGLSVMARLRPGVTLDQANAELQMLVPQFAQRYPEAYAGEKARFTARTLHDEMTREIRPAMFLLFGTVSFVLLIACVNVANLMLARGSARQRELEIRRALGAGRVRIIRQLLTESLVLAMASAAIGLVCTRFALKALGRLATPHIPLQSRIEIDAPVALFALVLSVITSMLFGLLPGWRLAAGKTAGALRAGRAETSNSSARNVQRALVVAEVALSIIPLASGGLMLRSFLNLMNSPLGFSPADLVTAKVPVDGARYPQVEHRWAVLREVLDRVRALPEVDLVSAAWPLPLASDQQTRRVGRADELNAPPIIATQQFALPGYLGVMGTPLREGRDFTADDVNAQRKVTIIDETLAKRLWPQGAIGQRLVVHRTGRRDDLEIVGVTAAVRVTRVGNQSVPHFMLPYGLYPPYMSLVVKTRQSPERMAPGITTAVNAARAGRAAYDMRPMSSYVSDSTGDTRFMMSILMAFAGVSVVLSAVGLYGTLSYLTTQRTREFGIRLALGSSVNAIVAIVIRESIVLAAAGVALGLIGVAAVTGAIQGWLYGVRALDGLTLAGVAGLVAVVALAAASVPAWRAAQIDPQASLRSE